MEPRRPIALVTGASAGIGEACVKLFAARGWDVAALARRREELERLAEQVQGARPGAAVLPLVCDVGSDAEVDAAFARAGERFGGLDALINNAGYAVYGTVEETSLERFRENMETNYFGVLRCTKAALPLLRAAAKASRRRWGAAVVMVSSFVGRRALPAMGSYCASKFALEGLSESLRLELADEGISVSVINPGVTKTEFFDAAQGSRPKGYLHPGGGMPSETVARAIFDAVRRPRRNVYLTIPGKIGIVTQWLSPRLLDFVLGRTWKGK